jgi:hypothetical protein
MPERFTTFREFYPFYLSEHQNRTSRRFHFAGTALLLVMLIAGVTTRRGLLLVLTPVVGYGFAWIGHFLFEKNRPATFRYPLYSLRGDFTMFADILRGKIPF